MAEKTGKTTVEPWLVNKLTAAFDDVSEDNVRLEMPTFQRGIVWSAPKQAELIRSLKRGFPVGSLLFYRKLHGGDEPEVNLLIDGLQRTTAIREYQAKPLVLMSVDDLAVSAVDALLNAINVIDGVDEVPRKEFLDSIAQWMLNTETLQPVRGFDATGLIDHFRQTILPDLQESHARQLLDPIRTFQEAIKSECDISGINIPILFYQGPEGDLPDIFERINATGTRLSKYEVFAAAWVNQETTMDHSPDVREAVRKRYYTLMTEKNISVNGVKPDGTPETFSLFDYLFGLGKVLAERFPLLFGESSDATSMESVAFALATICHRLPMSQMKSLPQVMDKDHDGCITPDLFENAVIESADFVATKLAPFIGLKLNADSATSGLAHSDLQIASMVARALVGKYAIGTWEVREGSDEDRERLSVLLPQYYLVDVLQQNWRGSGDNRLWNMTWDVVEDESTGKRIYKPSGHYLRPVGYDDWQRYLEQWYSDQVKLNQRSRSYVTSAARLFLKFVYSDVVTVHQEAKQVFELDHVFPVSRLVNLAKASEEGWPISAVPNLALFDWQTNREKLKMDLPQYLLKVPETERQAKREAVEKYLFLPIEDAGIPCDEVGDILTKDQYLGFLRSRFDEMSQRLMTSFDIVAPTPPVADVSTVAPEMLDLD